MKFLLLHVMHFAPVLRRIVMCVLSDRTALRYVISGMAQFSEKKKYVCFECLQICMQHFSICEEFKEILLYIKRGHKNRINSQNTTMEVLLAK